MAISELYVRTMDESVVIVPIGHHNWTKLIPTIIRRDIVWPIWSMLWVRSDLEVE